MGFGEGMGFHKSICQYKCILMDSLDPLGTLALEVMLFEYSKHVHLLAMGDHNGRFPDGFEQCKKPLGHMAVPYTVAHILL